MHYKNSLGVPLEPDHPYLGCESAMPEPWESEIGVGGAASAEGGEGVAMLEYLASLGAVPEY